MAPAAEPAPVAPAAPAPAAVPEPAAPGPEPLPPPRRGARPASTGFQAHFRTGASIPVGEATGAPGDDLGRRYAWQVPIAVDLGAKVTPSVFIGAYLQLGFGAEGSDVEVEALCDDDDVNLENDVSCSVVSGRLGVEGQWHFEPAERVNPWLGYGVGFEVLTQSIDDRQSGYSETHTATGVTLAQLSGGVDFRGVIGGGPFLELSLGRFTHSRTEIQDELAHSGEIDDTAWHGWITLGARMVVRP